MENWKLKLQPVGSFRGVPFYIQSHEHISGRNKVGHEIPDKNTGKAEDLGKKTPDYRITAFVIGSEYFALRDALKSALDESGAGVLIHPYLGLLEVQPGEYTLTESSKEGGLARFEMTFIDAPEPSSPFAVLNAITDFANAATRVLLAVQTTFVTVAKFTDLPAYAVNSATALVLSFAKTVKASIEKVVTTPERVAELGKKLDELENSLLDLFATPDKLAFGIAEPIGDLGDTVDTSEDNSAFDVKAGRDESIEVYADLFEFGDSSDLDDSTPVKAAEKENADAIKQLINQTAMIKAAEATASKEFKTLAEAIEARERIVSLIDAQIGAPGLDDNLVQDFKDLKYAFVNIIPNPLQKLATVATINQPQAIPAIVLAYDLYGSTDNETDLINRNQIKNPTFVSGDLEVISGTD